ncbi:MAG: sulfotransferase family 2 domain-containing protein [Pseudomonadota bacterium]
MAVLLDPFGIAYFPIPKVANSTIRFALEAACPDGFENIGNKRMSPGLRRRTAGRWRFAVVRDPLARALSGYANRVVHERDIIRSGVSVAALRLLRRTPRPDPDTFFQNLRVYMLTNDRVRRHLMLQRRYLGTDLSFFDAIYRIDELPRLARELSARLGREVVFGHHQTGGPKLTWADLAPATRRALAAYLAPDYALLGAYFTPPWGKDEESVYPTPQM